MRFSVIIPSFLGDYKGAATNRDLKILRAIQSVYNQTFRDYEIIVIADGCDKTIDIVKDKDVRYIKIPKSKLWSGVPRNTGIEAAEGEYIVYLDIDDFFGVEHLRNISYQIDKSDWVWFDDVRYMPAKDFWYVNDCNINKIGHCGTSNICHRRDMPQRWNKDGYAHDYYFIESLRLNKNYKKIHGAEYFVCHIPGGGNIGGYDK